MKVIHKKLRGSANYGPPCIIMTFMSDMNLTILAEIRWGEGVGSL